MEKRSIYLTLDSRNRDTGTYPLSNHYIYKFDDVIKNVESVELVYAIYDKVGTDFYANIHIEEISPNTISNNSHIRDSFTQLPMLTYLNEYTTKQFRSIKVYNKPISKLTKFSIRFLKYDGSLYPMNEHLLIFQISYYLYVGNIEFNVRGEKNIEDYSLMVMDLPQNYTKEQLKMSYVMKRKSIEENVSNLDRTVLKRAFKDLYARLKANA